MTDTLLKTQEKSRKLTHREMLGKTRGLAQTFFHALPMPKNCVAAFDHYLKEAFTSNQSGSNVEQAPLVGFL